MLLRPLSLLLPAVLAAGLSSCSRSAQPAQAGPPGKRPAAPVRVVEAARRDVPLIIRAIGNVEASASVAVKSRVAGQIVAVKVREGADVRQGELLFELDAAPFEQAVRAAEAAVARDSAAEKQAEAGIARAQAQAEIARAQARRYQTLFKEGIGAREQADQMAAAAGAQDAQLNAERASLESARASLRADQARLEQARLDLGYTRIVAPIAGRAGFVPIKAGNLIKENDTTALVTLLQLSPAYVVFSLPEQHLAEVRAASAHAPLAVQALDRATAQRVAVGQLEVIDNSVDTATGVIRLKARFANADRRLWPGEFASVSLVVRTERDVVTIPSATVQSGPAGRYVWVVRTDSTAEQRVVEVSRVEGDLSVIARGLNAGERVILSGQLRVSEGSPVQVLPSSR